MNSTPNNDCEKPTTAILQMHEATDSVIARCYQSLRNVVILQDRTLLYSRTFPSIDRGNYPARHPGTIAPLKSVTKSVIAILTGMLIDQKLIASVDQPISTLLGSHSDCFDKNPEAAQLTLHHLLSMTTGFLWRDGRAGMEPMVERMMRRSDWTNFVVSLPVTSANVGVFQYNSAVSHLISAIIEEAADMSAALYAQKNLFSPLGITDFEWESDPEGVSIGGWGLSLSPLSMAKLGQFCLDHGENNGKQLLPRRWIEQMWTPYSEATSLHGKSQPSDYRVAQYGYQWWIRGNDNVQLYCAEGAGGQMICCLPAQRAVIVASSDYSARSDSLWPLIEKHWIPAIVKSL